MDLFNGQFDRLPPHNIPAEMCVIASMMLDRDIAEEIIGALDRDDFFQADHQILFDVIVEMHRAKKPVDALLIRGELEKRQLLEEIGGVRYLADILGSVPSPAHGVHYAGLVTEAARLRQIISLSNDALRDVYAARATDSSDDIIKGMLDKLLAASMGRRHETIKTLADSVYETIGRKDSGELRRIPTGFYVLDQKIGGLCRGKMTVVAGKAGMGKSQFLKQVVLNAARKGTKCGIVTIEEDRFKVSENFLANSSGVENNKIAYNKCDPDEWQKVLAKVPDLESLPIWIDDASATLSAVESSVTRMVRKHGCELIAVDYLQLIDPGKEKSERRESEVRKLSNGLKLLFKRLDVANMIAAQLNRGSGIEKPELHHLRDSGAIEQDGDLIILLHREDYYNYKKPDFRPTRILETNVAKNKDGPLAEVPLFFDGAHQMIRDYDAFNDQAGGYQLPDGV